MRYKQECPEDISEDWFCKIIIVDTHEWLRFRVFATNDNWLCAPIRVVLLLSLLVSDCHDGVILLLFLYD
jgi:hypothetical protein